MSEPPMEEANFRFMRHEDKVIAIGYFGHKKVVGIGDSVGAAVSDVFKAQFGEEIGIRMSSQFAWALPPIERIPTVEEVLGPDGMRYVRAEPN